MNWIFLIVVLIQIKNTILMSVSETKSKSFQFPDGTGTVDGGNDYVAYEYTDLNRQGNLTVGVVAGILPATITTTVSILGTNINGTCICVPTGQCTTPVITTPTDGSGQLDPRIVTNLSPATSPPAVVTPALACQTNLQVCCQGGPYQCGIRYPPVIGSRIPAAGQSAFGSYPWQAALLGPGEDYAGSGALIDNFHIITAAHKVTDYLTGRVLKARLGEWDGASNTEPIASIDFVVARIFIHPSYTVNNLKNDIAILRLATGVPLGQTPTINSACLPATSFVGTRCYVAGWGKNDFSNNGAYQAIQKEVDVPVRSQGECQSSLSATRLGSTFVFDNNTFMCAGGESGKDACTGDGGSPLMCQLGGRWFVAGLVSWGIGCATGGVPGVYVNVANYVPWIQTTVRT